MAKLVEAICTEIETVSFCIFRRKRRLEVQIISEDCKSSSRDNKKIVKCFVDKKPAVVYIVQCADENGNCTVFYSTKGFLSNRKRKIASMPYEFAEAILKKAKQAHGVKISGWYILFKSDFPIYEIGQIDQSR